MEELVTKFFETLDLADAKVQAFLARHGLAIVDSRKQTQERETLRTAREGLLAAAAVVEQRSPAYKLIEAGVKACDEVLK